MTGLYEKQPMFITFEGPEGSGKTLQIKLLAEFLRSRGKQVLTTREPGGTAIGDQVRAVLTRMENAAMHPRTEILLFLASRAQLVEELVRPQTSQRLDCDVRPLRQFDPGLPGIRPRL